MGRKEQSSGRALGDDSGVAPVAPAMGGPSETQGPADRVPLERGNGAAAPRNLTLNESLGPFVQNRLADLVDLGTVTLIISCVTVALLNRSFMLTSGLLAGSIIAAALCFLLASRSLRRCEGLGYERIFVAACAMAGGVMLFELFYHLGWPDSWRNIGESLTAFGLDLPQRGSPFSIIWAVMAFITVFVGARYMRVNRWVMFVGAMAAATFLLWVAVGYPNTFDPRRWPESTPLVHLIPPEYAHPRNANAPGWAVVSAWGAFFATVSKLFICVFPATLFMHHLGRAREGGAARPDDILARAWKALVAPFRREEPSPRPEGPARQRQFLLALSTRMAPVVRPIRRAYDFIWPKAADLADLFMASVIVVCVALVIINRSLLLNEGLLAGSLIGFALSYLMASLSLRSHKELGARRMFISLCALVSSIWLFEIFFHYWGSNQFNRFWDGFMNWNLAAPWKPFPLVWSLIMVSLVLVGARYMRLNRYFLFVVSLAVALFWIWKAVGFPVFKHPELWPQHNPPFLPLIPLHYALAPSPEAAEVITFWALVFNTVAKVAWCAVPGTLFLTRENLRGTLRERVWPPGPALKSLFMPWTQWRTPSATTKVAPADEAAPERPG